MKVLVLAATALFASTIFASAHVNHMDRDSRLGTPGYADSWRGLSAPRQAPDAWSAGSVCNGCATLTGGPSGGPNQS